MRKINKAVNILKNQGPATLAKKAGSYSRRKIKSILKPPPMIEANKELNEEYSFVSNRLFQISSLDIEKSRKSIYKKPLGSIKTANWFVPNFDHLAFGGIYTIFRFIEKFSKEGVENRIIIYDNPAIDVASLKDEIDINFPGLKKYKIIVFDHGKDSLESLPECDIAMATFWVSAYILLKFNKTKKKYYFIQDYEPYFYVAGSTFALAESTYRFGFRGLVNTPGLLAAVNSRHSMEGISFIPAVDQNLYTPDFSKNNERVKIFFYARPNNPRNAFSLGVLTIEKLIEKYGNKIEIITAGSKWDEKQYRLDNKVKNLGLLPSLKDVADLYRGCDIGFVFMLSKHPSYQPFEFMASGMATVTNNNEDNLWLLRNGENCLLSEPSPAAMAEQIGRLVDDGVLRQKIAKKGYETLGYTWEQQTQTIWNDIIAN